ncbi:oxaloacetate hydrolase class protein [Periconia macrospinosa]|uniref:Oxaloacetate hydrolase class protein n=1 Tax=Periconia macrospinosa TaxID=97972 RepID=A0A2V1E069_9PLEO|nr:oxaloacetate hydrolase class protein [Periconia macrospinosa]
MYGNGKTANGLAPRTAAARLRELLHQDDHITVCPGVYDGITARIALQAGFDCLYMTGAGTAASRLGMPDLGVVTMNDMATNAAMIASLDRTVPLIADADTGYGGPLMISRTVKSYIAGGVAGLHLEDQVVSKRCGHLLGKEVVDQETFISRIRAAVIAREEMRKDLGDAGDIVLIARTDALQANGFEDALQRLQEAIEAGADVAFLEGPTNVEQCRIVCQKFAPIPVLLNMVPGGVTPTLTGNEAKEAGFKVMIHPGCMSFAVQQSCGEVVSELKKTGAVKTPPGTSPRDFFTLCGLQECIELDKRVGGKAYSSV